MDLTIPPLLKYLFAWFTCMGGVWALFDRAEKVLTDRARETINQNLRTINLSSTFQSWSTVFRQVFDKIYDDKYFSWKSFYRSSLISIFTVAILFAILFLLDPESIEHVTGTALKENGLGWGIFVTLLIANLIPDYISIIETKFILNKVNVYSVSNSISFLMVDFMLTIVIYVIFFPVSFLIAFMAAIAIADFTSLIKTGSERNII